MNSNSSPLLSFWGRVEHATYHDQVLEDFANNPLLEALSPILLGDEPTRQLGRYPAYKEEDRNLPPELRYHLTKKVRQFFQPFPIHLDLRQRFDSMLRSGYEGRNPLERGFWSNLDGKLETFTLNIATAQDQLYTRLLPLTALGFTIVGMSGIGKTKAIEAILSLYPQLIIHSNYNNRNFNWLQVVWLKLECPHDGSTKGLCQNFLAALDSVLGTNYLKQFGRDGKASKNEMLTAIARLASIHTLGMLVIDEVQRISKAKSGGVGEMLNFFTELVNTIGIPIVLAGTYKALSVLMGEFHQARRGSGQGDLHWFPMKEDDVWELFVESLWDYQYTREETKLTPQLSHTLYEVSQGITDIAVKAYMLAQRRAITIAMTTPSTKEIIDENIILSVAQDSIALSNYVLSAMRNGKLYQLIDVEDIHANKIDTLIQGAFQKASTDAPGTSKTPQTHIREKRQEQRAPDQPTGTDQESGKEPDVNLLKGGLIEVTTSATAHKVAWYDALNGANYIMPIHEYDDVYLVETDVG
jgi:hypothetical protein